MITAEHAAIMACPLCRSTVELREKQLACANGHSFDIAKQGYVNLLPVQQKKSLSPGDSKDMVKARKLYLDAGYYNPIADKLNSLLSAHIVAADQPQVLDAGCGEGFYLDRLMSQAKIRALGLDISKDAVVAASKRNKVAGWVVGTNAKLPFVDNSFNAILCLFGFPCYEEFSRVLSKNGIILTVDAGENHLIELRRVIYPEVKKSSRPGHKTLESMGFENVATETHSFSIHLDSQAMIHNLLAMTPHLYKAPLAGKKAAENLTDITLTAEVVFRVFKI